MEQDGTLRREGHESLPVETQSVTSWDSNPDVPGFKVNSEPNPISSLFVGVYVDDLLVIRSIKTTEWLSKLNPVKIKDISTTTDFINCCYILMRLHDV